MHRLVCALRQRHNNREVAAGQCVDPYGPVVLLSSWHLFQESCLCQPQLRRLNARMGDKEDFE